MSAVKIRERFSLKTPADKAWAVAADVASYPEFVPRCRRMELLDSSSNSGAQHVIMHIDAPALHMAVDSQVSVSAPDADGSGGRVEVTADAAHAHDIKVVWLFEPQQSGGCAATFRADFTLRSPLWRMLYRVSEARVRKMLVDAFRQRMEAAAGAS